MATSDIHIRPIEPQDFNQIADLYYRFMPGDKVGSFIGSCGRRVFRSYLKGLYASPQGSLWCAATEDGRVIGFTVGVIDRERFDRQWFWRNIVWLGLVVTAKFFFLSNFRSVILARLRAKLRGKGKGVPAAVGTDISRLKLKPGQAIGLWIAVDKAFRGGRNDVASQLIMAREQDLRRKGVVRMYSFTARTNRAAMFIHLKNGWQTVSMDSKRYLVAKDL